MAYLARVVFGGHIMDNDTGGSAVEEWSNSLSLLVADGRPLASLLEPVATAVGLWVNRQASHIDRSVQLEFCKVNQFDELTGKQVNDPTLEFTYLAGLRGGGLSDGRMPTSTSYRVSLDNGTRNRNAKGGFFSPRTDATVQANGRFTPGTMTDVLGSATTLLQELNAMDTGGAVAVGVYSRKDQTTYTVTRLRIGDVPDNVSRRRNALPENYSTAVIAP